MEPFVAQPDDDLPVGFASEVNSAVADLTVANFDFSLLKIDFDFSAFAFVRIQLGDSVLSDVVQLLQFLNARAFDMFNAKTANKFLVIILQYFKIVGAWARKVNIALAEYQKWFAIFAAAAGSIPRIPGADKADALILAYAAKISDEDVCDEDVCDEDVCDEDVTEGGGGAAAGSGDGGRGDKNW